MSMQPPVVWLILFALFVVIELVTMGLTTIWFAGGALAAMFVSLATDRVTAQVIVFMIVTALLLLLVRPWAKKYFNHERVRTNADSLIGETAVVIEAIDNLKSSGRVSIHGQEWMARSASDDLIYSEKERVRIIEISGVKLIVSSSEDRE